MQQGRDPKAEAAATAAELWETPRQHGAPPPPAPSADVAPEALGVG